mgnify:CR=1 FL=1
MEIANLVLDLILISLLIFYFFVHNKSKNASEDLTKQLKIYNENHIKKEVVFKISGEDLVGVLSKYHKKESEV